MKKHSVKNIIALENKHIKEWTFILLNNTWVKNFQDYSWIQDFEADFP